MAWTNGNQRTGASQWKALREKAKRELEFACQQRASGTPCGGPLELDHIKNFKGGGADNLSNLQWLCRKHHMVKTQGEAADARRARVAKGFYPPQTHPGLV